MQLAVINVFILRYSLTGGHHNGGKGGGDIFLSQENSMNCHYDEALKMVTYLRYILIKRFGCELNVKISDDDTCVMRGTATSSDTRLNEEIKFSFRRGTAVLARLVVCCDTVSRLWRPRHRICYGMSSSVEDFNAKRPSCLQTRQKVKVLTYKMYLKSEIINLQDVPEK